MSRHQIPYPRWRRVVDNIWPFNPWSLRDGKRTGRHEKTMTQRLHDVSPYDVPFIGSIGSSMNVTLPSNPFLTGAEAGALAEVDNLKAAREEGSKVTQTMYSGVDVITEDDVWSELWLNQIRR